MQHSSFKTSSTFKGRFGNGKDFFIKRDAAKFVSHAGLFLSSYFRRFVSFHAGHPR